MYKYISLSALALVLFLLLFSVFLTYYYIVRSHKNTAQEMRIKKTISDVNYILNKKDIDKFNQYLYDDVLPALNVTTVESLKIPTIASAKISHYQSRLEAKESLLIQIAWIESEPSIDGVRIKLPSESLDVTIQLKYDIVEDSEVLFFYTYIIQQDDPQWKKWVAILDHLKTGKVYVSLLQNRRVVSKESPLKIAAPTIFQ